MTDSAKAIALGTAYDGDVWDFYAHTVSMEDAMKVQALMIGCLLTYPATGTEVSGGGVITNDETLETVSYTHLCLRKPYWIRSRTATSTPVRLYPRLPPRWPPCWPAWTTSI